ncbi:hypothetical protein BDN72DRAFT_841839, partial [Pluteus cervinus]
MSAMIFALCAIPARLHIRWIFREGKGHLPQFYCDHPATSPPILCRLPHVSLNSIGANFSSAKCPFPSTTFADILLKED